jgi:hypothetical protein
MSDDLRAEVARAIAKFVPLTGSYTLADIADAALAAARPVIERETREAVANRLEGAGDVIPLLACFATFVSGNKQPCMSGDPRDRLHPHQRRWFDDAMREVAATIRSQP